VFLKEPERKVKFPFRLYGVWLWVNSFVTISANSYTGIGITEYIEYQFLKERSFASDPSNPKTFTKEFYGLI